MQPLNCSFQIHSFQQAWLLLPFGAASCAHRAFMSLVDPSNSRDLTPILTLVP
jgi:hypothetical protein